MNTQKTRNDFSKGSISGNILRLAVPMTLAQLVNVLYNVVDRVYIGLLPEHASLSLAGLGICLPVITFVMAFANLYGMGGAPLTSIERGRGNLEEAERIMGTSFNLLVRTGLVLTVVLLLIKKPMLYLLGASDAIYPFASSYLSIYMLGNVSVMIGLGMNMFINAQGFAGIGMMTVIIGAVANLILDPVFIFLFHMGVQGAALATIISQTLSAVWILRFLTGDRAILTIKKERMKLEKPRVLRVLGLGASGFMFLMTNSLVQMFCNSTLQKWGGDLYITAMTVIMSVRELAFQVVHGVTNSAQPVIGYNYGAKEYGRVKQAILFTTGATVLYAGVLWAAIHMFPEAFIRIFNREPELLAVAVPAIRLYFFAFIFMALQSSGQSTAVGLGRSKQSIFFSIFRKVIIVVPLTILLPYWNGLGTDGVFLAEPISNVIGGSACYITMLLTIWRELTRREKEQKKAALQSGENVPGKM